VWTVGRGPYESKPIPAFRKRHDLLKLLHYSNGVQGEVTTLYRPVGKAELDLIRGSGFREFPARLSEQPFFYPVLHEEYATQIARDWNTKDAQSGFVGYVLRFKVLTKFLSNYETHTVGNSVHQEHWIPAADLQKLNENIVGLIEVISEFLRSG